MIDRIIYEIYKTDWLNRHTTTKSHMRNVLEYAIEASQTPDSNQTYEEWVEENGILGSLYVCFNEFLQYEYLDENFIKGLIEKECQERGLDSSIILEKYEKTYRKNIKKEKKWKLSTARQKYP